MKIIKSNNLKKFHYGMSLAEVLITLGLIGTVSMLAMPVLRTAMPDEYEIAHKRAFYTLEHTVSDIVNNEDYYDDVVGADGTISHGLKNTYKVTIDGQTYGSDNPGADAAKQKFCRLFTSKLNTSTASNCAKNRTYNNPTVTTQDGVKWILPFSNFSEEDSDKNQLIVIYVAKDNPREKCGYMPETIKEKFINDDKLSAGGNSGVLTKLKNTTNTDYGIVTEESNCRRPNVFVYAITPTGKIISPEAANDKVKMKD